MTEDARFLRLLLGKWKVLLLAAAVGLAVGVVLALIAIRPQYVAELSLFVNDRPAQEGQVSMGSSAASTQNLVSSSIVLIKSRRVLDQLEKQVPSFTKRLERSLQCRSLEGTQILKVSVRTANPELSMQIAGAVLEIYPQVIEDVLKSASVQIVDEASIRKNPDWVRWFSSLAAGGLVGVVLSLFAVVLWGMFHPIIGMSREFEDCYDVRLLGRIPGRRDKESSGPLTLSQEEGLSALEEQVCDEYRKLRENVEFCIGLRERKCLAVVSAERQEGRTETAVFLGAFLAQAGARVVVLDCDLRSPAVHWALGLYRREEGITKILSAREPAQVRESIEETCIPNLSVILSGRILPNPDELLKGKQMQALLNQLEREFDYIILDTPPVTKYADAMILSKRQCSLIMVVREGKSDQRKVDQALKSVRLVEGDLLGAVLISR